VIENVCDEDTEFPYTVILSFLSLLLGASTFCYLFFVLSKLRVPRVQEVMRVITFSIAISAAIAVFILAIVVILIASKCESFGLGAFSVVLLTLGVLFTSSLAVGINLLEYLIELNQGKIVRKKPHVVTEIFIVPEQLQAEMMEEIDVISGTNSFAAANENAVYTPVKWEIRE
jgi:hypothetical protein